MEEDTARHHPFFESLYSMLLYHSLSFLSIGKNAKDSSHAVRVPMAGIGRTWDLKRGFGSVQKAKRKQPYAKVLILG